MFAFVYYEFIDVIVGYRNTSSAITDINIYLYIFNVSWQSRFGAGYQKMPADTNHQSRVGYPVSTSRISGTYKSKISWPGLRTATPRSVGDVCRRNCSTPGHLLNIFLSEAAKINSTNGQAMKALRFFCGVLANILLHSSVYMLNQVLYSFLKICLPDWTDSFFRIQICRLYKLYIFRSLDNIIGLPLKQIVKEIATI